MKIQTLAALLLVLGLTAAGCSGGGGSSEAASKVEDGNTGLETPVTPIVDVPPVVIAPVPTIAIDQGVVATSDPLLALAFDRPGMQQMKIHLIAIVVVALGSLFLRLVRWRFRRLSSTVAWTFR